MENKLEKQFTKEEAIALIETHWWEGLSAREICTIQLYQSRLCMPFEIFHNSVEKALGRPVFLHELGLNYKGICKEFEREDAPPTFDDIIDLLPEDKRVIVLV